MIDVYSIRFRLSAILGAAIVLLLSGLVIFLNSEIESLLCDLPAVLGHFERRLLHDVR